MHHYYTKDLRFSRSMSEAFPWHGVIEYYGPTLSERIASAIQIAAVLGVLGWLAVAAVQAAVS